jgi:hypothetical protein
MNARNESDLPSGYTKRNDLNTRHTTTTATLPVFSSATGPLNRTRRSPKDEYEHPDLTLPSVSSF